MTEQEQQALVITGRRFGKTSVTTIQATEKVMREAHFSEEETVAAKRLVAALFYGENGDEHDTEKCPEDVL